MFSQILNTFKMGCIHLCTARAGLYVAQPQQQVRANDKV